MLLLVFQTSCFLCTEVTGHIEDNIYFICSSNNIIGKCVTKHLKQKFQALTPNEYMKTIFAKLSDI